jgi:hypothetical protein
VSHNALCGRGKFAVAAIAVFQLQGRADKRVPISLHQANLQKRHYHPILRGNTSILSASGSYPYSLRALPTPVSYSLSTGHFCLQSPLHSFLRSQQQFHLNLLPITWFPTRVCSQGLFRDTGNMSSRHPWNGKLDPYCNHVLYLSIASYYPFHSPSSFQSATNSLPSHTFVHPHRLPQHSTLVPPKPLHHFTIPPHKFTYRLQNFDFEISLLNASFIPYLAS